MALGVVGTCQVLVITKDTVMMEMINELDFLKNPCFVKDTESVRLRLEDCLCKRYVGCYLKYTENIKTQHYQSKHHWSWRGSAEG